MHPDKIEIDPILEPTEKDGKASKNLPRTSRREWFRTTAYQAGIPLLRSSHVPINFEAAASMVVSLVESLCSKPLPEKLAEETRVLDAQLHSAFDAPHRAQPGYLITTLSSPRIQGCCAT